MKKVVVLGQGAWATAMACVLADAGCNVSLWCHDPHIAQDIAQTRKNESYLPGIMLPKNITPSADISIISQADIIFEAIPVSFLRSVLEQCAPHYKGQPWVILSKGIEQESCKVPSQIIQEVCGQQTPYAVISGPSFAKDVAEKKYTAVCLGAIDKHLVSEVTACTQTSYFMIRLSDDRMGMQVAGALKNAIALALGMLDGAGYGDNTKAWLLMRGFEDMQRMVAFYGGQRETCFGLSGFADLVLTSYGGKSRNVQLGYRLGKGEKLHTILESMSGVVEGLNTLQTIVEIERHHRVMVPFFTELYNAVFKQKTVAEFVTQQQTMELR